MGKVQLSFNKLSTGLGLSFNKLSEVSVGRPSSSVVKVLPNIWVADAGADAEAGTETGPEALAAALVFLYRLLLLHRSQQSTQTEGDRAQGLTENLTLPSGGQMREQPEIKKPLCGIQFTKPGQGRLVPFIRTGCH